jgi:hypothetical protein
MNLQFQYYSKIQYKMYKLEEQRILEDQRIPEDQRILEEQRMLEVKKLRQYN